MFGKIFKSMHYHVSVYFALVAQYLKSRLVYRFDFFISSLGFLAGNVVGVLALWVIFQNINELVGWTYAELVFIYGFTLLALTLPLFLLNGLWDLGGKLQDGSFINYYFKPVNMLFYIMSEKFDEKGIVSLAFSVFLLVYASAELNLVWGFKTIATFLIMIIGASLVFASMILTAASVGFWTVNPSFCMMFIARIKSYAHYPINIYSNPLKIFFSFVLPLAYIAYYPCMVLLRPGEATIVAYISPLVGLVAALGAYRLWTLGVASFSGTGS
ncbi:MAG: hypothetical protein COA42_09380 [Alteromonadaceae bacterium]|nr:MAG: hypothetical protein COA42_09380 [Alteromonadaceae bacterium]